ncbi:nucleoside-diphosphate sugar epimerase [Ectothiorhodospira haloalkaliphila]|uniref:Nucleoside-diphosphate sugar epimerase n=2 Tax=Ectothiorhodospira haloalkaliphila TaxID=421628 RepID=W8KL51_9GAMM|nr:NAD(P)H-binding protein [Ectothiorhodospira haloalkaliphila]AHK80524.1 nucleoside-diphosphate sugar epimerase [Ectothiorhodospira haloalkaliphila]
MPTPSCPLNTPRITVAGASGFIGTTLCRELAKQYPVTALTRSPARAETPDPEACIQWQHCDLFSQDDVTRALQGCDYAIYLVHSLAPSSRLTQAAPRDMDLILADNFARAAAANGVKQILFVGGYIPDSFRISTLLWSRREVEMVLGAHGVPITVLRAGLVVGPGGSASRLMVELVRRMGVLFMPPSARSVTRPIALQDLNRAIQHAVGQPEQFNGPHDIGGPQNISYVEALRTTARLLNLRRRFIILPWLPARIAALGARWVTGTPTDLVAPVIDSLPRDTVIRDNPLQRHINPGAIPFEQALNEALDHPRQRLKPSPRQPIQKRTRAQLRRDSRVRSIQRIILPPGQNAAWVAGNYFRWLTQCCWPLVVTEVIATARDNGQPSTTHPDAGYRIHLRWPRLKILELTHDPAASHARRQVYRITGGLLARNVEDKGRFEFHTVLDDRYTLAAIHDFAPALPWYIYLWTQAVGHLLVMRRYQRHLARLAR